MLNNRCIQVNEIANKSHEVMYEHRQHDKHASRHLRN